MSKTPRQLEVKYLPIKSLRAWKDNPRLNDGGPVAAIVKSIQEFGYTNPILVRKADKRIIAGHTRVKALQEIGETHVPVILLDMTEQQADTYAVADNKLSENTPWDLPKLSEVMAALQEQGVDLELTGFTAAEVGDLLTGGAGIPDGNKPIDEEAMEQTENECPKCGFKW